MSDPRAWLEERQALADAATDGRWGYYTPRGREGRYDPVFGATPGDEVALVKRPNDWRFIADARQSVPAMAAALTAVLDLHVAERWEWDDSIVCSRCGPEDAPHEWPCETVRAIEAALGGEE